MTFDERWLREYQARTGCRAKEYGNTDANHPKGEAAKRPKYGNRKTELGGRIFDSAHEANVYAEFKARRRAGDIAALALQTRFYLANGIEYVADFVTFDRDGMHVIDAKSEATRRDKVYRIKKKLMREKWGIEIEEV